jgi:hypothetical protein
MNIPENPASRQVGNVVSHNGGAMCTRLWRVLTRPEGEAMSAVQHLLAFARPLAARVRSVRRPFRPSQGRGPYRLPHDVADRLREALAPFRNREAAYALAVFVARHFSLPKRVTGSFRIMREPLAEKRADDLGLTQAQIRGAIRTLEAVGFLERAIPAPGSLYRATGAGLHRKPIQFVFGSDYAPLFIRANARAVAARERRLGERRSVPTENARRPSAAVSVAPGTKSPEDNSEADPQVNSGEIRQYGSPPLASVPDSPLEAALERLGLAILNRQRTASTDEKAADRQGPPRAEAGRDS